MKVYELINELSKLPAGAKVELHTTLTESEVKALPVTDIENDENMYSLTLSIHEAITDGDLAILYN